jgi:diguanylate cyclase (GGDEF)-like protein
MRLWMATKRKRRPPAPPSVSEDLQSSMPPAPLPPNEAERLAALRAYDILDTNPESSFDDLVVLAAALAGCPAAAITLVDAERSWFKARIGLGVSEVPRGDTFCAYAVLQPDRPLLVPDAAEDPRFADFPVVSANPAIRAYAGMPLVSPEGYALGTLCVFDHVARDFDAVQQRSLTSLARAVVTALELRRAGLRVREMALTDVLTGIANRPAFLDALVRAVARQRRDGQPFALLCLDLDGFKRVNDLHGHAAGDAVLREVAAALSACLRREDLAARIGGDEFAAVLVGGDGREISQVAERVRRTVEERMETQGRTVTASVGAVSFLVPPKNEAAAIAEADRLMYAAKAAGMNRVLHRSIGVAEMAEPD